MCTISYWACTFYQQITFFLLAHKHDCWLSITSIFLNYVKFNLFKMKLVSRYIERDGTGSVHLPKSVMRQLVILVNVLDESLSSPRIPRICGMHTTLYLTETLLELQQSGILLEKVRIWSRSGNEIWVVLFRKVQTESATGSSSSSRVRTMLTVEVETIDFDTQACVLRLKGRNVEENPYVKVS